MKGWIQSLVMVCVFTFGASTALAQATSAERALEGMLERKAENDARAAQMSDEELRAFEQRSLVVTPYEMTFVQLSATSNTTASGTSTTARLYRVSQGSEVINVLRFAELTSPEEEYQRLRRQRRTGRIVRNTIGILSLGATAVGLSMVLSRPSDLDDDDRDFVPGLVLSSVGAGSVGLAVYYSMAARVRWNTPAMFFSELEASERVVDFNSDVLDELGAPPVTPAMTDDVVDLGLTDNVAFVGRSGPLLLRSE